ncbi:NAD(P)H-dependent oxidoreductase [Sediminitomix flava]|uniref:Putative NADPH-quinone reductase n=1 Tax=Sediminitomix flava TaxID=379075 RepID=A0A315ZI16_SEDFL|nr:NAD(P)H-dependent oxidoreductase [Sediminitomix flava]PWJ44750.1 putative NADPH-quinone reductase [Sediminitomix flava]
MKNILIINGHPDKQSYNRALAEAYQKGAEEGKANIDLINLGELDFDPILRYGYRQRVDLEPDLLDAIEKLKKADHLVWVFPMWWYSTPAILKGFIDRTFLPGITYELVEGKPLPKKLLKGKTARMIVTADSPKWYEKLFMGSPLINQFKKGTLEFCGVKPVKLTYIAPIKDSSDAFREKWLNKVKELGKNLK